jgi:pyruvate/2-oxoglutarate dehydrogenase complex dihydrolipoamide acyltransferase (E2) component
MALAKSRIPHITYVEEVDVTALEELRARSTEPNAPTAEADHPALPDARHGEGDRRAAADQRAL